MNLQIWAGILVIAFVRAQGPAPAYQNSEVSSEAPVRPPQPTVKPSTTSTKAPQPSTEASTKAPQPSTAATTKAPQPGTASTKAPQPSTEATTKAPQPKSEVPVKAPQPNSEVPVKAPQAKPEVKPVGGVQVSVPPGAVGEKKGEEKKKDPEDTSNVGEPFNCFTRSDGNYADSACSRVFWQCANGLAYPVSCNPPSLRYNLEINACSAPGSVPGCRHQRRMLPAVSTPCRNQPSGFYPDPHGDCKKYVFCIEDLDFTINCPFNFVYDDGISRCAPPDQVVGKCGYAVVRPFTCEDKKQGVNYRSSLDCSVFYQCDYGRIKALTCSSLVQAFEPSENKCRHYTDVPGCGPDRYLERGDTFCFLTGRDDVYPDPFNCRRAIICTRGKSYSFVCNSNGKNVFHPVKRQCVESYGLCRGDEPIE